MVTVVIMLLNGLRVRGMTKDLPTENVILSIINRSKRRSE